MAARGPFEQHYPTLTRWVRQQGWLEFGQDERITSLVRVLDAGGLVWEGSEEAASLSAALAEAEAALAQWFQDNSRSP